MDRTVTSFGEEALARRKAMLKTAFGPVIAEALADSQVVEVMVNPDGKLWLDRLDTGRSDTGTVLQWSEVERIIRLVASHIRLEVHERSPIVSAELPETGERFEGLIPPVAPAPCFSIRKPARLIHRLDDYVDQAIMTAPMAAWLKEAILAKGNIMVVGGTSSGKTTLVNALLAEVALTNDRVVILEDTRELNCAAEDCVKLRTKPGVATLADLVRSTLRLRPDRIIVGEVRGAEALDMLKAWNTGHPGGLATVHANSARGALYRIEQLVQESVVTVPRRLIAEAIDILVFLEGRGSARRVTEVARVEGLDADGDYALATVFPHPNPPLSGVPMTALRNLALSSAVFLAVQTNFALAAGSGMPWEAPLTQILESIEGPVARIVSVIIIIVTGLSLAFGDTSGGFRRLIQIVFGLSIAFAATSFFLAFFSFGGGALI